MTEWKKESLFFPSPIIHKLLYSSPLSLPLYLKPTFFLFLLQSQKMGTPPQSWHIKKHILIIPFLFLSVSTFFHIRSIAEGREMKESGEVMVEKMRGQIGSRPPICMRRCSRCGGHCEAVQVPVILHDSQNQRRKRSTHYLSSSSSSAAEAMEFKNQNALFSEAETSNYKPISWKCKCGNFIFNP